MHDPVTIETKAGSRPTVVKIGGAALEAAESRVAIAARLADLDRSGDRLVVVHGGGGEVDRLVASLGMETIRRDGIRITPPEQMGLVASVLAGRVNTELVASLAALSVRAVGLTLCDGGLAVCRVARGLDFDPGRVGEISDGDPHLLEILWDAGFVPVVASIGCDEQGELLNVNADAAAAGIARIANARELLLLTDVPGVRGPDGATRSELDRHEIESGIAAGWIAGGMIPKVHGALAAAEASGVAVRIAGWSGEDPGTRISTGEASSSAFSHPVPAAETSGSPRS